MPQNHEDNPSDHPLGDLTPKEGDDAQSEGSGTNQRPFQPPTHTRLFHVAAGLGEWTEQEREWLKENPKWIGYERELREAIEQAERRRFINRVQRNREIPPSIGE